jgi:hypothetical protein
MIASFGFFGLFSGFLAYIAIIFLHDFMYGYAFLPASGFTFGLLMVYALWRVRKYIEKKERYSVLLFILFAGGAYLVPLLPALTAIWWTTIVGPLLVVSAVYIRLGHMNRKQILGSIIMVGGAFAISSFVISRAESMDIVEYFGLFVLFTSWQTFVGAMIGLIVAWRDDHQKQAIESPVIDSSTPAV